MTNEEHAESTDATRKPRTRHDRRAKRIFSLIQPTGIPHLGNYLGALRTWTDLQYERLHPNPKERRNHLLYFGLADLHSLTLKQDPKVREANIRQTFAALIALGLNYKEGCVLFVQSHVPEHTELMWYLSNVASTGYLSRMTQWKDKIGLDPLKQESQSLEKLDSKSQEKLKLSLYSYPVLQAADILLYEPDLVPVGEDQAQHVEFTRHLARVFNSTYCVDGKPLLKVPDLMLSPAKRVMSLQDPKKKMSKSDPDEASRILVTDSADEIRNKIKRAKTDSISGPITYNLAERPGVSNLIEIFKHITRSERSPAEIADEHAGASLGAFKTLVGDAIVKEFEGIKDRYDKLVESEDSTIDHAMMLGRQIAGGKAGNTMKQIRKAMGLVPSRKGHYRDIARSE